MTQNWESEVRQSVEQLGFSEITLLIMGSKRLSIKGLRVPIMGKRVLAYRATHLPSHRNV